MKVARLKIAPSEANVKANRKESTKWTYHRKQSFASDIFIFFKKNFQFKNVVQWVDLMYQPPKCPCSLFSKALEFYLSELFPCDYP